MRTTELRVGNWIEQSGCHYQLDENSLIDMLDYWKVHKKCLHSSVPLTKEWLLKFGFESLLRGGFYRFDEYFRTEPCFSLRYYREEKEFCFDIGDGGIIIEHVHQLQNLYFIVTGEELILKSL